MCVIAVLLDVMLGHAEIPERIVHALSPRTLPVVLRVAQPQPFGCGIDQFSLCDGGVDDGVRVNFTAAFRQQVRRAVRVSCRVIEGNVTWV